MDSDLRPLAEDSVHAGKLGAVGMIIAGNSGPALSIATGFLISPCHVLTAAHVLAPPGTRVKIGMPVQFLPKGQNSRALVQPAWGRVVAADPDFIMTEAAPGFDLKAISRDWGLIELDRPLPELEPIKLIYPGSRIADNARFAIIGYPFGGRQISLHAQEHCSNWSSHGSIDLTGVIIADCAVRQGMSGGPLLIEGHAAPLAAGIVVERVDISRKVMAVAVPTYVFAETILAVMRESDVCAAGAPFALPPDPVRIQTLK
jgi:V8-like Glu-specific endopeptidase